MMQSKLLFLDESMTSMDKHTIDHIVRVLQHFVEKRDMKLYIVTHSHQIQHMDIWERVVDVKGVLSGGIGE